MKKAILILVLLFGMLGYGQSKQAYLRLGKLTTTEINAIDVTNTTVVYTAYDTTLGIEVINVGAGWVPRITASGISDGDKGDITVSSSGTVWSIDANAVLTSHIANSQITSGKLATASVGGNALIDNSVQPIDIKSSNANTFGYALVSLNGTDFTWVDPTTFGTADALLVHKSGTETITGNKTLSGINTFSAYNYFTAGRTMFTNTDAVQIEFKNSSTLDTLFLGAGGGTANIYAGVGTGIEMRVDGSLTKNAKLLTNGVFQVASLAGSGSRMVVTNASGGLSAQAIPGIEGIDTYYGILSGSTSATTYNINTSTSRKIDIQFSASTVAIDFTNEAAAVGAPIIARFKSTNAGGTVITFNSTISDINNNTGFSVTLAENEEITLHFVIHDSIYTWCTNYPSGTSMTPTQVKDSLLANTDTNILTDAEKNKLGWLQISDDFDADAIKVTAAGAEQWTRKKTDLTAPDNTNYPTTLAVVNAINSSKLLGLIAETASKTAVLTDANGMVDFTSASDVVYTIPENASVAFDIGTILMPRRNGTGNVSIAYSGAASGNTARTYQYGESIGVLKTGTDTWVVINAPRPDYESITIALSDLSTDIAAGTDIDSFQMQFDMYVESVSCVADVAGTTTGFTIDINESGTTILSTKLTTDATEQTSATASTPPVISDNTLSAGSKISFDLDAVPTGAQRLKVSINGYRL